MVRRHSYLTGYPPPEQEPIVELTPQDLAVLKSIMQRTVSEVHDVFAAAARRTKSNERPAPAPPVLSVALEAKPQWAYSMKQATQMLGLSKSLLYKMIQQGDIRAIRIGSRRLIEHAEIEALLSRARE